MLVRRRLHHAAVTVATLAAVAFAAPPASAFSILTGFSDGCHETVTVAAVRLAGFDIIPLGVPVPDDSVWEEVATWVETTWPAFFEDPDPDDSVAHVEGRRVMLVSLLVGVRSNDTHGQTALNLGILRDIHAAAQGQSEHCLRALEDDGVEGTATALVTCIATLREFLDAAFLALLDAPEDQLIEVPFTTDFYGEFSVTVWAPAYWLGKALHVVQDSFTHTLRTPDLAKIVHIMNYVEAIQSDFDEAVEGVPHSESMDRCHFELDPGASANDHPTHQIVDGAITASTDLLVAASSSIWGFDDSSVDVFVEKWFRQYDEEPCDIDNHYCDSPWLALAREVPTVPYLDGIVGCSASDLGPAWVALAILGLLTTRRHRCG